MRTKLIGKAKKTPLHKVRHEKLKSCAKCFGPGPYMFFSVDTLSEPGTLIFHFVQFKTLHIKDDGHFDQAELYSLHLENDPRLEVLADCIHYNDKDDEAPCATPK